MEEGCHTPRDEGSPGGGFRRKISNSKRNERPRHQPSCGPGQESVLLTVTLCGATEHHHRQEKAAEESNHPHDKCGNHPRAQA